jgi:cbb3-type cytochrome oxidase maturation protein
MEVLVLLIPVSVVLVLLIGAGFWWSVKSGQFDDLEGPAHRILADDDSTDVIPSAAADSGGADSKTADRALTPVKPPQGDSR